MNKKDKINKRIQGSISVLLVIILLPMMTFSAVIVDNCRVNMARQMMSSAGDLTMNTALANYDTILKDVYGLFAMSQAKGLSNDELGEELNNYFAKTLSSYGVVSEEDSKDYVESLIGDFKNLLNGDPYDTTNFLELNNIELTATKVKGSSLANASVLRKQIVEYMKYRAPMGIGLSFLDSLSTFEKMDDQSKVVQAQVAAQESTQDVTKACRTLIDLIRDYDKRVEEINDALTGATGSSDSTVILLENYDTHALTYFADWNENYTHINKLNLVFLANAPSVTGVYLSELSYISGERYVDSNGNVYGGNNTGFSVSPEFAGDIAGAEKQVRDQIGNLEDNYAELAGRYTSSMLPSDLLIYSSNNINSATISAEKEDEAISCFIKFERFLLDQQDGNSVTNSQVKEILEQIAILDKYRANYETYINVEIDAAKAEQQKAQNALDGLVSTRDNAAYAMNNRITKTNECLKSYAEGYGTIDEALSFLSILGTEKQQGIKDVLAELPDREVGYAQYYNSNIKEGNSNKYGELYDWLINESYFAMFGTENQKAIIEAAESYGDIYGSEADGFLTYMKRELTNAQEGEDLYKLLCCLYTCCIHAYIYNINLADYNETVDQIPGARAKLNEKINIVKGLENEKNSTINAVKGCLQDYHSFVIAYQADAYYYNYYINAAKNTIGPEAQKIQVHFSRLIANLAELREDLAIIEDQAKKVVELLVTYESNLDAWTEAKQDYDVENSGDSFSNQAGKDIDKAKSEYKKELYESLQLFVIAMWDQYDNLYSKLTESTNFTYGTKRIDQITSAQDLIDAVSSTEFSDVVTVEEATTKLAALYKGETLDYIPYAMDYVNPPQLGFLTPTVVPLQALQYLNGAYPVDDGPVPEEDQAERQKTLDEFETAKNKLTGSDTSINNDGVSSDEEDGVSNANEKVDGGQFGYTYESRTLGDNLPSVMANEIPEEPRAESEHKLSVTGNGDEERLEVSESVGSQMNTSSSLLAGIGNTATTALENLYLLNYIFENFSYSTIVQDQMVKDIPLRNTSLLGQLTETEINFGIQDNITKAKSRITTLSNFYINEQNNYLYGGEIEYIMFGNENPATNVASTNASIYAIRFAFNCVFAFTDSEIRNSTMAAGLAVQAATMGFVPYQVVQVVLQLALAAAESAIDLSAMNHGLSVVVVKTRDTWSLSMSGASTILRDAGNAAAQMVANSITDAATKVIESVTNGLNDVLDASADEMVTAIQGLSNSLEASAKGVLESVADEILATIMAEIETGLNGLQYISKGTVEQTRTDGTKITVNIPVTAADVRAKKTEIFAGIYTKVSGIVYQACGGNDMAMGLADEVFIPYINYMIEDVEKDVDNAINDAERKAKEKAEKAGVEIGENGEVEQDITAAITGELTNLKLKLLEKADQFIGDLKHEFDETARQAVEDTKGKLQGYINEKGELIADKTEQEIKAGIAEITNGFVDTTLAITPEKIQTPDAPSATPVKASAVSLFKFGYKDYLMLLSYISICCGDGVLMRTADVIQMNLQNAGEGAEYHHKANENGTFLMSNAYTYVSIFATAELDMFFMDLDVFANQVNVADGTGENTESNGTKIIYQGLLGY